MCVSIKRQPNKLRERKNEMATASVSVMNSSATLRSRLSDGRDRRPAHIIRSFIYWFPVLWAVCIVGNSLIIVILRRSLRPQRATRSTSDGNNGNGNGTGSDGARSVSVRRAKVLRAGVAINSTTLCLMAISAVDMCTMTCGAVWMFLLFVRRESGLGFVLAYACEHMTYQFSTWAEAYLSLTRCIAISVPHRSKALISTRSTAVALLVSALIIAVTEGPVYVARVAALYTHSPADMHSAWFVKWETANDLVLRFALPIVVSSVSSGVIVAALLRRGSRFSFLSGSVSSVKSEQRSKTKTLLVSVSPSGVERRHSNASGESRRTNVSRQTSRARVCRGISIVHIMIVLLGKNLLFFVTTIPCLVCDVLVVFSRARNANANANANASVTLPGNATRVVAGDVHFENVKNWFFVFHLFSFCDLSFSFFIYLLASHRFRRATLAILAPLSRCSRSRSSRSRAAL